MVNEFYADDRDRLFTLFLGSSSLGGLHLMLRIVTYRK